MSFVKDVAFAGFFFDLNDWMNFGKVFKIFQLIGSVKVHEFLSKFWNGLNCIFLNRSNVRMLELLCGITNFDQFFGNGLFHALIVMEFHIWVRISIFFMDHLFKTSCQQINEVSKENGSEWVCIPMLWRDEFILCAYYFSPIAFFEVKTPLHTFTVVTSLTYRKLSYITLTWPHNILYCQYLFHLILQPTIIQEDILLLSLMPQGTNSYRIHFYILSSAKIFRLRLLDPLLSLMNHFIIISKTFWALNYIRCFWRFVHYGWSCTCCFPVSLLLLRTKLLSSRNH